MNADYPAGLDTHPTDMSLGRHERCEVCSLWFPQGSLEFTLGKDRCPKCRDIVLRRGARHGRPLLR